MTTTTTTAIQAAITEIEAYLAYMQTPEAMHMYGIRPIDLERNGQLTYCFTTHGFGTHFRFPIWSQTEFLAEVLTQGEIVALLAPHIAPKTKRTWVMGKEVIITQEFGQTGEFDFTVTIQQILDTLQAALPVEPVATQEEAMLKLIANEEEPTTKTLKQQVQAIIKTTGLPVAVLAGLMDAENPPRQRLQRILDKNNRAQPQHHEVEQLLTGIHLLSERLAKVQQVHANAGDVAPNQLPRRVLVADWDPPS